MVHVLVRSTSARKRFYRRDDLRYLANHVCNIEGMESEDAELSVLFCDDAYIAELNKTYRKKRGPTDVLAFAQEGSTFHGARVLGDIVISLETVERFCAGDRPAMRKEARLLFCHGLLHLLGYGHATKREEAAMKAKQAAYLGLDPKAAWHGRRRRTK